MINDLGVKTVTNDSPPEPDVDAEKKSSFAEGRDAGTTSGTENYGATEKQNFSNPPEQQLKPSY